MLTLKEDQQSKDHHPDRFLPMVHTASIDKQRIAPARDTLLTQYHAVRRQTERLCQPLALEDYGVQSMVDVSPPKWHLAHTTWFFENFLLHVYDPTYREFHPRFGYLFNSYYETVGVFYPRSCRGLLSRPTVEEVFHYRSYVDTVMEELIASLEEMEWGAFAYRVTLGIHHEQQHQELLLTDIKHIFATNPLRPVYREPGVLPKLEQASLQWVEYTGGLSAIGHAGDDFAFDNEAPRHRVYLEGYALASRLVTNGEFMEFIEAGGYEKPEYWLSDGWRTAKQEGWYAPLYWERIDGRWWHMSLGRMQSVWEYAPVCHVSYYEADAFVRWAGTRLPTEAEWEHAASERPIAGNLYEAGWLCPLPAAKGATPLQVYGDVWEWTQSPYLPYPGYHPPAGALGEYNGKFMCNQIVLRGGSCVTPASHIRASYRNFFFPRDRWQFTGIRLAEDR